MTNKTTLIHFGAALNSLPSLLSSDFEYLNVSSDFLNATANKHSLFTSDGVSKKNRNDLFLITDPVDEKNTLALLKRLPANRILTSRTINVQSDEIRNLNFLKHVQHVSLDNLSQFARTLARDFFVEPFAYKIDMNQVAFDSKYPGKITQHGHNFFEVTNTGCIEQFEHIATWRQALPMFSNHAWDITVESQLINPEIDIEFRLQVIDPSKDRIEQTIVIDNDHLSEGQSINVPSTGGYLLVSLYVKGTNIDFKVGGIHARQSREGFGLMVPGGHRIVDKSQMNEELMYYFNAGDLKPPLNVYFAGYRPAEGFEGTNMMRDFNAPFLLISDPRLVGGAFYVGSKSLGTQLIEIIQDKLRQLGFTRDQLILSGLSMGTFGALFFSSRLSPHAVIVGKPLIHLGSIAANGRIERPDEFTTSFDTLQLVANRVDETGVKDANELFWKAFEQGDYSQTKFIFAYMENDDYDLMAFEELSATLREKYPRATIIHKGLIGRHNDDTSGIITWFIYQYKNVLRNDFGRLTGEKDE